MATRKRNGGSRNGSDAIRALTTDHKRVKALFREFAALKTKKGDRSGEKAELVQRICQELKIHTQLEEGIFYPAVRELIRDDDLMDEALVEHAGAKTLVEQLETMNPDDDLYDAKVTVLGEQISHHVKEEEGQIFPKAKKAKLDTATLGAEMAERKAELQASESHSKSLRSVVANSASNRRVI